MRNVRRRALALRAIRIRFPNLDLGSDRVLIGTLRAGKAPLGIPAQELKLLAERGGSVVLCLWAGKRIRHISRWSPLELLGKSHGRRFVIGVRQDTPVCAGVADILWLST